MHDHVRQGNTKQDDKHDVADASNSTATAHIVAGKRRENAPRMRGVCHKLVGSMNS